MSAFYLQAKEIHLNQSNNSESLDKTHALQATQAYYDAQYSWALLLQFPPNCGKMSAEQIKEGLDLIQHTCTTAGQYVENVSFKPDQNAAIPLADCSYAVGGVEKQMEPNMDSVRLGGLAKMWFCCQIPFDLNQASSQSCGFTEQQA